VTSEEQNEGNKMEVDSVVTLEPQPTELVIISTIGIFFNVVDGSIEVEGVAPIQIIMLVEVITHFVK
jgi:hypothetical protein